MAEDAQNNDLSTQTPQQEGLPERLRVHSLARVLGTTSRRVLDALAEFDGRRRSAHSTVDKVDAERVRDALALSSTELAAAESAEPAPAEVAAEAPQAEAPHAEAQPAPDAQSESDADAVLVGDEPESRLILDQRDRRVRGVNFCTNHWSSTRRAVPSIQPWRRASSSAPSWFTDVMPVSFLAILSQRPGVSACSANQAANSAWPANPSSGNSLGMQCDPLAGRAHERQPVGRDLVRRRALQHADHRRLAPHDVRLARHLRHPARLELDRVA